MKLVTPFMWIAALSLSIKIALAGDPAPPATPIDNSLRHEQFDACRKEADERKLTPDSGRRQFIRTCLRSERSASDRTGPSTSNRSSALPPP